MGSDTLHSTCKIFQRKDIVPQTALSLSCLIEDTIMNCRAIGMRCILSSSIILITENHFCLYKKIHKRTAFRDRMNFKHTSCALVENCKLT